MLPASESLAGLIALVPAPPGAAVCGTDGVCRRVSRDEAREIFGSGKTLVAHAAFVAGRLKAAPAKPLFDVLELFAFVRPGQPMVPSALGLARLTGLEIPDNPEDAARALLKGTELLLQEAAAWPLEMRVGLAPMLETLARAGWRWAEPLKAAMDVQVDQGSPIAGLEAWRGLPQWEDIAPAGTPGSQPVTPDEAKARLMRLTATPRPEQAAYAEAATYAFGPREDSGAPRIALVEAGTGTGKTLGYLAPASLWAEKNGPGLWISTYTRNLQRQIVQEMAHLYPDPVERAEKVVVRKGRENYLCLLNFEEAAKRTALAPGQRSVALGLIARWVQSGTDGDISGAGFPAFLAASMPLSEVTDRSGECIYAACTHYRTCFIESAIRRARHAPIVIANHALVIAQADGDAPADETYSSEQTTDTPPERRLRYVFDEGHHLFDAADSGFSALISGRKMAELRRWLRGPEGRTRTRMRGLEERLKDLIADDEAARETLDEAVQAAGALAGDGWMARVSGGGVPHSRITNPGEVFLAEIYAHVRARSDDRDAFYTLEAEPFPLNDEGLRAVDGMARALSRIEAPLSKLARALRHKMDEKSSTIEPYTRARLEAAARGLERRAKRVLPAWRQMLETLQTGEINDDFTDWFEIKREEGRDYDVGFERHWVDPTVPLAAEILEPAHGALITSATLRDTVTDDAEQHWQSAEVRTGALHLPQPPRRASFGSPFRYDQQARIFVVTDVPRRQPEALAAAMRELFLASGGGGLGLFTAVRALRDTEARIAQPLADAGIPLYAQHVDRLDTGALVDLFRAEENACLLGTDALRDGVDVPGRSLRLAVFDKVPWPKPTILHKSRRVRFGKGYDDLLTRFRLKQAFGRLIRGPDDKGCFVILEGATPSRLLSAFPEAAPVKRCGLAEAVGDIRQFLG